MGVRAKGTLKSIPISQERVKNDTQKSREAISDGHKSEMGSKKVPLKIAHSWHMEVIISLLSSLSPPSTGLHSVEI